MWIPTPLPVRYATYTPCLAYREGRVQNRRHRSCMKATARGLPRAAPTTISGRTGCPRHPRRCASLRKRSTLVFPMASEIRITEAWHPICIDKPATSPELAHLLHNPLQSPSHPQYSGSTDSTGKPQIGCALAAARAGAGAGAVHWNSARRYDDSFVVSQYCQYCPTTVGARATEVGCSAEAPLPPAPTNPVLCRAGGLNNATHRLSARCTCNIVYAAYAAARVLPGGKGLPAILPVSVGSAYARKKRKIGPEWPRSHTKQMGGYCRGLTAHVIHSTL